MGQGKRPFAETRRASCTDFKSPQVWRTARALAALLVLRLPDSFGCTRACNGVASESFGSERQRCTCTSPGDNQLHESMPTLAWTLCKRAMVGLLAESIPDSCLAAF